MSYSKYSNRGLFSQVGGSVFEERQPTSPVAVLLTVTMVLVAIGTIVTSVTGSI